MLGFDSKSSATDLLRELLICLNEFDVDANIDRDDGPVCQTNVLNKDDKLETIV